MEQVKDLADPNRCKAAAPDGQCRNVAEHGSDYCLKHHGKSTKEEEERGIYLLNKAEHRRRLTQLKDHEEIKSLREEISLTRILIEERWNQIKTDADLLASCAMINTMMLTLERLIKTSHTIEQNLGALLAKPTVILLGQTIVQILVDELSGIDQYEQRVDRITDRLFDTIETTVNVEKS